MKFYIASLLCIAALLVNGVAGTEEQCVDKIPGSCWRWAYHGECTKAGEAGASTRSYCCKSCTYRTGKYGSVNCPEDYTILTDIGECETKAAKLLKQTVRAKGCFRFGAVGCVYTKHGIFFNTCGERPETSSRHKAICVIDWKYKTGEYETVNCPKGYSLLTDRAECESEAAKMFGKRVRPQGCFKFGAVGCVYSRNGIFFNTCGERPETSKGHKAICVKDVKYKTGEYGTVNCPKGYSLLTDRAECENQAAKLLKKTVRAQGCFRFGAVGCVYKENGIFFNTCGKRPETSPRHKAVCVKDKEEAVKGDVPTDLSDEEVIQEVMRKSKVHQVADDIALEEDYM